MVHLLFILWFYRGSSVLPSGSRILFRASVLLQSSPAKSRGVQLVSTRRAPPLVVSFPSLTEAIVLSGRGVALGRSSTSRIARSQLFEDLVRVGTICAYGRPTTTLRNVFGNVSVLAYTSFVRYSCTQHREASRRSRPLHFQAAIWGVDPYARVVLHGSGVAPAGLQSFVCRASEAPFCMFVSVQCLASRVASRDDLSTAQQEGSRYVAGLFVFHGV